MAFIGQTSLAVDVLPPDYINVRFYVPIHRQLIIMQSFFIDTQGTLIVDGKFVIL